MLDELPRGEADKSGDRGGSAPVRRGPGRPSRSNAELLDLAFDLFSEHGFERTSIEAICAAAGMAKRTVYARYGDKTSLFKAALRRAIERWILPLERLRAAETGDIEETLLGVGRMLVANVVSPAGLRLMRLTNAESGRMPEIGAYAVELGTEPTRAYLGDLLSARLDLDAATAQEAALAFLHLVVGGPGNNAAWGVAADAQRIEELTRYAVRLFLHGVAPRAG